MGIKSCELLSEYTATYPCLREVGILLKEFLSLHDLNSAYRGKKLLIGVQVHAMPFSQVNN